MTDNPCAICRIGFATSSDVNPAPPGAAASAPRELAAMLGLAHYLVNGSRSFEGVCDEHRRQLIVVLGQVAPHALTEALLGVLLQTVANACTILVRVTADEAIAIVKTCTGPSRPTLADAIRSVTGVELVGREVVGLVRVDAAPASVGERCFRPGSLAQPSPKPSREVN